MAVITIKSTYSLDVGSVRTLEALAQRWYVSRSEVLRRAIRIAAVAIADDASIATANPKDYRRFEDSGLPVALGVSLNAR